MAGTNMVKEVIVLPDGEARDVCWRFVTGNKFGRAGRPLGSKVRLSEKFLTELGKDFNKHGAEVIQQVRTNSPETYLRVIAQLVPKEMLAHLEVSGEVEITTRREQILSAYRLLGEDGDEAEVISDE
jgi:hypothetical protein